MAIVLPVACAAFYMPSPITDTYNYVQWEHSSSEPVSCRETEGYRNRKLVHETIKSHETISDNNSHQTATTGNDRESKSETGENMGNEGCLSMLVCADTRGGGETSHDSPTPDRIEHQSTKVTDEPTMLKHVSVVSHKRKLDFEELRIPDEPPRKISMRDNTPKQRRDEKKRILRMSVQKLKRMDDPEVALHRAVLINNTVKRMQREIKEEKRKQLYGESVENTTFPRRITRDCQFDRDLLFDSQNTPTLPLHSPWLEYSDYRQYAERLADDGYSLPIFPGLLVDTEKSDSYKSHSIDCTLNTLISAFSDS